MGISRTNAPRFIIAKIKNRKKLFGMASNKRRLSLIFLPQPKVIARSILQVVL